MLSQLHSAVLAYITLAKDRFRDGAQPLGLVSLEDEVLADVGARAWGCMVSPHWV